MQEKYEAKTNVNTHQLVYKKVRSINAAIRSTIKSKPSPKKKAAISHQDQLGRMTLLMYTDSKIKTLIMTR